jgi:beta-RFAP synthase
VAVALAKLAGVKVSIPELAVAMGRAKRTSVGTTIFQLGGFVVDGGKNQKTNCFPPLIYRQPFPKEWRFIVAIPNIKEGLSNSQENYAFHELTKMSADDVGQICRLTMLKLLPALAEKNIESFGDALTKIQVLTGNHFAQVQGGTYSSPVAAEYIEFMKKAGAYGVGQSSWGPALYGIVKQQQATQLLTKVKAHLQKSVGGEVFIARANNRGATVKVVED